MEPKPRRSPKTYHEGPEAAHQFDALVGRVLTVPHEVIKNRHAAWEKDRKGQRKKGRSGT